ncbi:MAG: hypothetical protein Q4C50_02815 [Eubacteriales bacterium]|nr:hypothetical protein [Eubacteriales bacterium]
MGTIYHIDAYTNSIINTLYFAPHELYSASIYGHYGLFYIIPCKLLRILGLNEWLAVAAAIAITGGICFALGYWTLHKMVRSDTVYYLSVLACTVVSTEIFWGQYFQMLPHRLLFQTVMMACFLKIYTEQDKHRRHVFMAIGWLASACAILWNIEIGAVCALVWTIGIAFLESQERGKWSLIVIIKNIAFLAGAFFLAYGIVNLYNIAVGGKGISVSTFIYPIGSKSYVIEKLYLPLMNSWGPYFAVIASFLVVLGYYFMDFLHLRLSIRQLMMLLAAIMGYGVYTYYINRPVEGTNASICIFPLVFVLTVLCDNYFGDSDGSLHGILRKPAQSGTSLFALTILVSMALASVSTFGKTLSEKISTTYDETLFKETKSELLEKIPEGTVAFGTATAQLFAYANMDTGLYFADWEDLVDLSKKMSENGIVNPDAEKFLVQSLIDGNYEYILVYSEPSQERYLLDKYEEIDSIEYNSMCWKLYRKTLEGTTS